MADTNSIQTANIVTIHLRDNLILKAEELKKYFDFKIANDNWPSPTLQFISFKSGKLTFRNTSGKRSFLLYLQILNTDLLVACDCGHKNTSLLCVHAFKALSSLVYHWNDHYFQKLRPGGLMETAFAHMKYFDKKETPYGLDLEPRPELQSVFRLGSDNSDSLHSILDLPGMQTGGINQTSDEAISYLIILSFKNRMLPALLPCTGKLNKDRTAIKSFYPFISGIQKQYAHLLTADEKEMNAACHSLWKMIETVSGTLIPATGDNFDSEKISATLHAWQKLIPHLREHRFVYAYSMYSVQELRRKPEKSRTQKIRVSGKSPELRFLLTDKKAFYSLEMQVWADNHCLTDCDTAKSLFILHQHTLYLLSSVRDAAIAQWIHQARAWTIFKTHFQDFEREVLQPLQQYYSVTRRSVSRTRP